MDEGKDKVLDDLTSISANDAKRVNKVLGIKDEPVKKTKLPKHIRKAIITINDKKPGDPLAIEFQGEWDGKDINLVNRHLITEFQLYMRNIAIGGK